MHDHAPQHRLEWLDYARFSAAFSVLSFHYLFHGIRSGKINSISDFDPLNQIAAYGYLGVDIFFIISGFVILYSASDKSADEFAVGRALRLYPSFIVCMTTTALLSQVWGGEMMRVTLSQYILNLTMMPTNFGANPVDGVYWTLKLEILFYLTVFLILLAGLKAWIYRLVAIWLAVLLFMNLLGIEPPGRFLLDDYYVLFAGGCMLAFIYRQGLTLTNTMLLIISALLSAYTAVERSKSLSTDYGFELNAGIVAAVILAFYGAFLISNTERITAMRLPYARLIGALTYPLYLLHAHFGYMLMGRFGNESNKWLVLAALVIGVTILSALIHEIAERRLRLLWARMFNAVIGGPVRVLLTRNS